MNIHMNIIVKQQQKNLICKLVNHTLNLAYLIDQQKMNKLNKIQTALTGKYLGETQG